MPGEEESSRLVKSFSTILDEVGRKENEPDNEAVGSSSGWDEKFELTKFVASGKEISSIFPSEEKNELKLVAISKGSEIVWPLLIIELMPWLFEFFFSI